MVFSLPPHCPKGGWNWTLGALQPCASCHPRGTRKGPKRVEGDTASHQPLKNEACPPAGPRKIPLTLLLVALLHSGTASANPHQPPKITWMLHNGLTQEVFNSATGIPPILGGQIYSLTLDLCEKNISVQFKG